MSADNPAAGLGRSRRGWCRGGAAGVTLPEMLVVVAIIGLFLVLAIPVSMTYIRAARVRSAAGALAKDLSACRYVAVTTRTTRTLALGSSPPATSYNFVDVHGRTQVVLMPEDVRIISAANFPVTFTTMGALSGPPATVVVKGSVQANRAHEYTIDVGAAGKVTTTVNRDATP